MCWKCEITLVFSTPHILVDINTGFVFTSVLPINITKDVLVVGESAGIAIVPGSWLTSLTITEISAVVSRSVPSSDSRKIFDFLRLKILWDHSASYISCRRSTSKPCSTFLSFYCPFPKLFMSLSSKQEQDSCLIERRLEQKGLILQPH